MDFAGSGKPAQEHLSRAQPHKKDSKHSPCIRRCGNIITQRCVADAVCPKALRCMSACGQKPYSSCGKLCMRDHRSPIMHDYLKCVKVQCHGDPQASLFDSKQQAPDKSAQKTDREKLERAAFPPYK